MKNPHWAKLGFTAGWICVALWSAAALGRGAGAAEGVNHYRLYEPKIEQHYLYKDGPGSPYAFGHMASIEFFDGKFHAVWNNSHGGHAVKYFEEKKEAQPFQRLLWQTSPDARQWSEPLRITETHTTTPLDQWADPHTHWQPNLLNYRDLELWCLWSIGEGTYSKLAPASTPITDPEKSLAGTYLSRLGKGPDARWVHQRIFSQVELSAPGSAHERAKGYLFPSQNPVLLPSGRVLQPVTLVLGTHLNLGSLESEGYFSAVIYTDDDGKTWAVSNLVSNVDNPLGEWEPCVLLQADGRLRMYIRDSGRRGIHAPMAMQYRNTLRNPLFLTTTGTGTAKGEPVVFEPDAKRVWIETEGSRMQSVVLPGGRHCMFHHDVWNSSNFGTRSNLALFFSRTGEDDFVAGPGIAGRSNPAHYAQGIVHDRKLYVAYTRWNTHVRLGGSSSDAIDRGIAVSIIDPLPEAGVRYVWPRDKDFFASATPEGRKASTEGVYQRPSTVTFEGRPCIKFEDRGSAGVEIDRVDFTRGEKLGVAFEVRIGQQQAYGNLVFCSFGGQIPIRLGVPGNRPDSLYAYGRNQWERIGAMGRGQWHRLTMVFGADEFTVQIDGGRPVTCMNPIRHPERRLYLGDGYEIEPFESNRGSDFLIDLKSLQTWVATERGNK